MNFTCVKIEDERCDKALMMTIIEDQPIRSKVNGWDWCWTLLRLLEL